MNSSVLQTMSYCVLAMLKAFFLLAILPKLQIIEQVPFILYHTLCAHTYTDIHIVCISTALNYMYAYVHGCITVSLRKRCSVGIINQKLCSVMESLITHSATGIIILTAACMHSEISSIHSTEFDFQWWATVMSGTLYDLHGIRAILFLCY